METTAATFDRIEAAAADPGAVDANMGLEASTPVFVPLEAGSSAAASDRAKSQKRSHKPDQIPEKLVVDNDQLSALLSKVMGKQTPPPALHRHVTSVSNIGAANSKTVISFSQD